jgi:Na+/melibiose symporter-like transporter
VAKDMGKMIPWIFGPESVTQMQFGISILGAGLLAFFGILIAMVTALGRGISSDSWTKKNAKEAFFLLVASALFLVFGMYFLALFLAATALYAVYALGVCATVLFEDGAE